MPITNRNLSGPVPGTVAHFANSTAPAGWLKCNGAAVSRATYAALFAAIGTTYGVGDGATTFNLPELRGEFLRGLDDGRGVDPARGIGTAQLDQMQKITGSLDLGTGNAGARFRGGSASGAMSRSTGNASGNMPNSVGFTDTDYTTGTSFDSANSPNARVSATTAGETRARNVAMLACIKF